MIKIHVANTCNVCRNIDCFQVVFLESGHHNNYKAGWHDYMLFEYISLHVLKTLTLKACNPVLYLLWREILRIPWTHGGSMYEHHTTFIHEAEASKVNSDPLHEDKTNKQRIS